MVVTATVGGLIAGAVMSVEKMIEAALRGEGLWRPPNLIASILLGRRADTGRFLLGGLLLGMALHALASAFMGWLYGVAVAEHVDQWPALVQTLLILGYALIHWAAYQYLIMRWLAPVMDRASAPASLAVGHLVWGFAFAAWFLPMSAQ